VPQVGKESGLDSKRTVASNNPKNQYYTCQSPKSSKGLREDDGELQEREAWEIFAVKKSATILRRWLQERQ